MSQRVPLPRTGGNHIVPCGGGGQDNIENLQLLCGHCNRVKGDRPQEYLVARLKELGIEA